MNLPFTYEQFLQVFSDYNQAVWPMQIVWNVLAVGAVVLAIRKTRFSGRVIGVVLAMLWVWMGVVYHWMFFSPINPAARLFGALFVVQGLLFLWAGVLKNNFAFPRPCGMQRRSGALLMLYGLLIYPILGAILGHTYPECPTFGLPCPTTIFTLGLILWAEKRPALYLMVIPLLWSVIGFMAALRLGIYEDIGLLVAGLVTAVLYVRWKREEPASTAKVKTVSQVPVQ